MTKTSHFGRMDAAVWLFAFMMTGCSGGSSATVTGTVTGLGGRPVADAQVTFHPTAPGGKSGPFGARTDSSGKFTVLAQPLEPGTYKVTVTKFVPMPGAPAGVDPDQLVIMGKAKNTLPVSFGKPETTPLEATLKPGSNVVPLTVQK